MKKFSLALSSSSSLLGNCVSDFFFVISGPQSVLCFFFPLLYKSFFCPFLFTFLSRGFETVCKQLFFVSVETELPPSPTTDRLCDLPSSPSLIGNSRPNYTDRQFFFPPRPLSTSRKKNRYLFVFFFIFVYY